MIGFAAGQIPKIPLNLVLLKGCSIIGVFMGANSTRHPRQAYERVATLIDLVAKGKLRPLISASYPLERTAEALKDLMTRKVQGKIVVTPAA